MGRGDNAGMHKRKRLTPLGRLMDAYNSGAGISDNELGRRTGVSQATITRIANGSTKEPKQESLAPLAAFFGVSLAAIRGEEQPKAAAKVTETRRGYGPAPQDLSPEAVDFARLWMRLSPARRATYHEEISWVAFFERKFPYYRIGRPDGASYDKFEQKVESHWEQLLRQATLPLDK